MPVITTTMSEDEQAVIEAAIEYVAQLRNGLYRDVPPARCTLVDMVDRLVQEHDDAWQPKDSNPIDIVFDGPPSPDGPRFVEVESPPGTGIKFGDWIERDDGFWALRFNQQL